MVFIQYLREHPQFQQTEACPGSVHYPGFAPIQAPAPLCWLLVYKYIYKTTMFEARYCPGWGYLIRATTTHAGTVLIVFPVKLITVQSTSV